MLFYSNDYRNELESRISNFHLDFLSVEVLKDIWFPNCQSWELDPYMQLEESQVEE